MRSWNSVLYGELLELDDELLEELDEELLEDDELDDEPGATGVTHGSHTSPSRPNATCNARLTALMPDGHLAEAPSIDL